jgi:hypothetical protein
MDLPMPASAATHDVALTPVVASPTEFFVDARYFIVGLADPGLLPRLVEPFSKLGAAPTRVHASREAGDGSEMSVDLRLTGATPRTAELIEHALRRVVGVSQLIAVIERSR